MFDKTTKDREVTGRSGNPVEKGADVLSVISRGMSVKGDCMTDGQLLIEGKITGNVNAQRLELTAAGSVDGDVIAVAKGKSEQVFVISGLVTGTVHAAQVEVRRGGKVQGGVVADEAVIHGQVYGGILARKRLTLEETAEVEGDVHARRLGIKEGGQVNGNIHMGDRADLEGKEPTPIADRLEAKDELVASAGSGT